MSRHCRWLRKKRHESDEAENEYLNAWAAYVKQQRLTRRMIMNAKVESERSVIQSLREKGMEGGREWYKFMRGENMSGSVGVERLKVEGVVITEKDGIREAIKGFWEEVGGVGEMFSVREECVTLERKNADELDERISRDEVERCVRRQKNGKAAGPDDIPYEFYKNGGEVVIDRMTELFNRVWDEERVPRKWNESRVCLLHKGGFKSKNELKNYRPIALVNTELPIQRPGLRVIPSYLYHQDQDRASISDGESAYKIASEGLIEAATIIHHHRRHHGS
ncbi:uncharacterized protein LOC135099405 isoform X1 [Scylla paramamosain]|uniref:uncharacterized protein LOC135099405 isoform X1 n=1 Tax=Scylla paramamosain TaxID=85552 RepID=UPI003083BC6B